MQKLICIFGIKLKVLIFEKYIVCWLVVVMVVGGEKVI